MNIAKLGTRLASGIALTVFAQTAAFAQTAQPQVTDDTETSGDIIVTATRREQALQNVPVAISAYNTEDLSRLNVTSTSDLQRIAPSLVISTSANETNGSSVRIRGVGTTGLNAGLEGAVGIFIDNVYRQRAGLALQNLFDVQRIEVLRGPQGTLFGKNTTAGAISIVPSTPSAQREMLAQVTVGNYGNKDFQGMANIPVSEKLALRISGDMQVRDGFIDGIIVDNVGVVAKQDFNNRDRKLVRAMALFSPNNAITWRITADYAEKDEACCAVGYSLYAAANPSRLFAGGVGGVTMPTSQFDRLTYVNESPVERTIEWGVSNHLSIDLGDSVQFKTVAAYRRFKSRNNADVDYGPADIVRQRVGATQQMTSIESSLSGTHGRLDWLFGMFWSHEQIDNLNATLYGTQTGAYVGALLGGVITPPPHGITSCGGLCALYGTTAAYPIGGGDVRIKFQQNGHSSSIFTHNTFHLNDHLSATLGLRYIDERKEGGVPTGFTVNSPTCNSVPYAVSFLATLCPRPVYNSKLSETHLTGMGSLNWQPTNDILVYVGYSHGYKAGGINLDRDATVGTCVSARGAVSPSCTQAQIEAAAKFLPEIADSYETGIKTQWFNRKLTVNLAGFKTDFSNFQLNTFNGLGFIISNPGMVKTYGGELEMRFAPTEAYFGTLGVAYTHARYGNEPTLPANLRGLRLTNAPDWQINGSLNAEHPISQDIEGFANLNASYRSEYNTGSNLAPQKDQRPFTLIGAQIGVRSQVDAWDIYLWGENLTNERYYVSVADGVFQTGSFTSLVGNPATYGVTLRKHF